MNHAFIGQQLESSELKTIEITVVAHSSNLSSSLQIDTNTELKIDINSYDFTEKDYIGIKNIQGQSESVIEL